MVPHQPTIPVDTQVFYPLPACGSAPSPNLEESLVLNTFPEAIPIIYAFRAPTLGMPSNGEYAQLLTRYLDEMTPTKRGKALVDSELLERIMSVLTFQHEGSSGASGMSFGSDFPRRTACGAGEIWNTQPFRRWARNTFIYRQATQAELERAVDFGLLSPPESSLSGPGVPGHPPSTRLALPLPMNLVFHRDRPVALRQRIYKIILRAHWIANHSGRDRTWALVQEICSYIPKRLVYDFVAACPTCRVARSGQYGKSSAEANCEVLIKPSKFAEKIQHGLVDQSGEEDLDAEGVLLSTLLALQNFTPSACWTPQLTATVLPIHTLP